MERDDAAAHSPLHPLPCGHRFPKRRRIRKGAEFSQIIKRGTFATDATLVLNAMLAPSPKSAAVSLGRLGVTVPTKTGNAVARNRWKRLIREAYRLEQGALPIGFDLVVRPRRGAVAELGAIRHSLRSLARRATHRRDSPGRRNG